MGLIDKFVRATTFSLGIIIVIFLVNSLGFEIIPNAAFSTIGFVVLVSHMVSEIFFNEE